MKHAVIAAALAILLLLAPAAHAQNYTPGEVYSATYFVYGAYVRAGAVCQYQPFVSYGMSKIASPELKTIGNAFETLTTEWAMDGATTFNGMVMKQGLVPACRYMVKMMNGGAQNPADLQS